MVEEDNDSGRTQLPLGWRRVVLAVRFLLTGTVLGYLIHILDWNRLALVLPRLSWGSVGQVLLLVFFAVCFMAVRWTLLLRPLEILQGPLRSLRFYLVGSFYGILLPGLVGLDAVRLGLSMKDHPTRKAGVVSSVLFERVCGLLTIVFIAAGVLLLFPGLPGVETEALSQAIYTLAFLSGTGLAVFFLFVRRMPGRWAAGRLPAGRLRERVDLFLSNLRRVTLPRGLCILLLSALAHMADILACYLLAKGIQIHLPLSFFALVIPLVYILSVLPISMGGLGVREGVLAYFLTRADVLASDAVTLAFLIYLSKVALALTGGIVQFVSRFSARARQGMLE